MIVYPEDHSCYPKIAYPDATARVSYRDRWTLALAPKARIFSIQSVGPGFISSNL